MITNEYKKGLKSIIIIDPSMTQTLKVEVEGERFISMSMIQKVFQLKKNCSLENKFYIIPS